MEPAKKSLDQLLAESKAYVDSLTPEQKEGMIKEQAKSFVRGEMDWPKAKFKMVEGVKVYDSYEDYCND